MPDVIDPDIRRARTLPSDYYTSEERLKESLAKFPDYWHFAAHRSQFGSSNVIPIPHLEGMLGEPMVLTCEEDIKCLSNVCSHRGIVNATSNRFGAPTTGEHSDWTDASGQCPRSAE